jgi:hypothetical protein
LTTFQANVIFQGASGLPADQYVNTWHFYTSGAVPLPTDYDNVRDMLKDFYVSAPTGGKVATYMTSALGTTAKVKLYNLDEPKPRVPVYESTFALAGLGTGTPAPYQVAICLSFEGARVSGEPQARKRNRVYIGPLASSVQQAGGLIFPTTVQVILDAAKRLHDAANASLTWDWKVYSGTENKIYDVSHIWVDNAFDTQRRRALAPTTRNEFRY